MKRVFEKVKPDNRIIIGYGTSLFLLLVVYVVTLVANTRLKDRTDRVEHTYKVMFALESFISKIKDAETGVRGYFITRDLAFLEPYVNSERAADSIYAVIRELTLDNRLQQQRLDDLKKHYKIRFVLYRNFLNLTVNGVTDTAFKLKPAQDESKKSMDKIRSLISFMQLEEKRQLLERDEKLKTTFTAINTITIISLLLTLILVIIGFVSYTSENKARKEGLQRIQVFQDELKKRIDELNTANEQLIKMRSIEKFAATGRIARTIAHEVRNPLTNIDLAASQLKSDLNSDDEGTLYFFDVIQRNSTRINKLISDLLQSTKFSELNLSKIPVSKLIDDTLTMAKDRIELQQVLVEKNYQCLSDVLVDADRMKIAFLNIIINALEAMEQGKAVLKIETITEGNNCVVIITDNGHGMDETALTKLFEPYFTNKPKGNGLGLANTQNIIFNHKGSIHVNSQMGKGTSFIIGLPVGE
ncbi:MAG TPA: CHASE3 domain-containing protein [Ferruginibacter sp.]|nr:CHASE3 domain-containing protein [Ferruginibacter sp.]HPH90388.1 CHASE3 domain-containing protein [Ferruginibacter sp.]